VSLAWRSGERVTSMPLSVPKPRAESCDACTTRTPTVPTPTLEDDNPITFGVVDEREGDEQTLFLAAGQRHEPGISLVAQPWPARSADRRPRASGYRDAQKATASRNFMRLWSCDSRSCTPFRSCSAYTCRVGSSPSTEMAPRSGLRRPSTHSIVVVLAAPFGPITPKDLPRLDLE
jgi:hypothetical protein